MKQSVSEKISNVWYGLFAPKKNQRCRYVIQTAFTRHTSCTNHFCCAGNFKTPRILGSFLGIVVLWNIVRISHWFKVNGEICCIHNTDKIGTIGQIVFVFIHAPFAIVVSICLLKFWYDREGSMDKHKKPKVTNCHVSPGVQASGHVVCRWQVHPPSALSLKVRLSDSTSPSQWTYSTGCYNITL